ncbi:MAG: RluA family pseudouridine synthase [Candidatus Gracilibacteria bacterium]|nr:RluA family pseudouridine synthase [Candidatus Gracilibacteria bacterium]MDQ7022672.1 RluA family pseudouridine synthase [Candidatus Gracilibacteria bacterium]
MQIITIEENDANQRLDKFLKKLFINATRALIYKFNRKSKIKVKVLGEDGFQKRDNDFKIGLGDEVKLFISDKDIEELSARRPVSIETGLKKSFDKKDIVFEDSDLFIINKNFGINVHPGDFKSKEVSIIQQVQDYLGEKFNSLTFKPSLVHRIDRDTSGILMIAKKKDILSKLVEDFKNHKKIKKTYLAICFGKLPQKSGTITKKLLRIENAQNRNKVEINEKQGQIAISHYKGIEEFVVKTKNGNQNISVVEVQIETGRMHQIRVHLESIKCPIIGDKAYGNKSLNHYFEKDFGVKRQMLHAYKISFFHYGEKKNMELEAKMKKDMQDFLDKISFDNKKY